MVRAMLLLVLTVLTCQPAAAQSFAIQMTAEPESPYVQQQVLLNIRFFRDSPFLTGYFVAPEIEGALVEAREVRPTVTVRHEGRDMEMLEKTYLIFPQASGRLIIPGMVFSGREVFAQAKPLELMVRPPPEGVGGHWMPAQSLTAREEWRLPEEPLEAGMSFERRVIYEAVGLTAAQLPSDDFGEVEGIELERLPPILEDRIENGSIVGRRVERILLTPLTGGTLGAISQTVTWWDTNADQPRYIHLPGRALRIKNLPLPKLEEENHSPVSEPLSEKQMEPLPPTPDAIMALGAAFGLSLGLLFVWRLARWSKPFWARRRTIAAWERARRQGNLPGMRQALLGWGEAVWLDAPPKGLREMAERSKNPMLAAHVDALEEALYGNVEKIPPTDFIAVKKALRRASVKTTSAQGRRLPPLNPVS